MKTKFQKELEQGFLNKETFENSHETKDFLLWLIPVLNGKQELGMTSKKFSELISGYHWPVNNGLCLNCTIKKFQGWRSELSGQDEQALKQAIVAIFTWGGVMPNNQKRISNRENWFSFLTEKRNSHNNQRIFLDDLNPNHISSAYTKLYSAFDENWLMYDSRVGAGIGLLVRDYLIKKGRKEIPNELSFGWAHGRGNSKRDPSNSSFKFPNFQYNRIVHYKSNILLNWLIFHPDLMNNVKIKGLESNWEKAFAVQSGLFELGK